MTSPIAAGRCVPATTVASAAWTVGAAIGGLPVLIYLAANSTTAHLAERHFDDTAARLCTVLDQHR